MLHSLFILSLEHNHEEISHDKLRQLLAHKGHPSSKRRHVHRLIYTTSSPPRLTQLIIITFINTTMCTEYSQEIITPLSHRTYPSSPQHAQKIHKRFVLEMQTVQVPHHLILSQPVSSRSWQNRSGAHVPLHRTKLGLFVARKWLVSQAVHVA